MKPTCDAVALILLAGLSSGIGAQVPGGAGPPPLACDVETFAVEGATVTIRAAGLVTPATLAPAVSLPERGLVCRVQGAVSTASGSLIGFEVWIPPVWNGKIVATGNGGYSNALSYRDMAYALTQGYAAVGGDTGHQTPTPDDLLWGAGHQERIEDWGSSSIHLTLAPARHIVELVAGTAPRRAYFYGCSTGGHQGYAEIQRFPQDFDGVIAGAPANNRVRLNVGFLWQFLANRRRGDNAAPVIPASKLPAVTRAVVQACDAGDGVTDGVVDDPRTCRFDPAVLQCREGDQPDCLTAPQVAALGRMYDGARNPRTGEQIYPGWPRSSEALTLEPDGKPASGWQQYWGTTEPARSNFWRHWVFGDPGWDWWSFDFDRDLALADRRVGRLVDQTSADIDGFRTRGGKAIVYQGWQDPVVNAIDTIDYYEKVRARQGSQSQVDGFYRLFLVPGMGHCSGGPGTTNFGNQNGASPVVDADHDLLSALDAWVERGQPPDRLVASRVVDGTVTRTRPLCPYPGRAVYAGRGSTDDAANFVCR